MNFQYSVGFQLHKQWSYSFVYILWGCCCLKICINEEWIIFRQRKYGICAHSVFLFSVVIVVLFCSSSRSRIEDLGFSRTWDRRENLVIFIICGLCEGGQCFRAVSFFLLYAHTFICQHFSVFCSFTDKL